MSDLILRRFVASDARRLYVLSQEASLKRFLPDQVYSDEAEAAQTVAYLSSFYDSSDHIRRLPYVVGVVFQGELIGHMGVSEIPSGVEVGYAIAQDYQGRGLAKQALGLWLAYLHQWSEIRELWGIVDHDNLPSIRVLSAVGFTDEGERSDKKHAYRFTWD